jgi:hypothetical protein
MDKNKFAYAAYTDTNTLRNSGLYRDEISNAKCLRALLHEGTARPADRLKCRMGCALAGDRAFGDQAGSDKQRV